MFLVLLQDKVKAQQLQRQCTKKKGGLIERVLEADSNQPSLASGEREPSEKDDTKRHMMHIM